jgi:hypothetical protein
VKLKWTEICASQQIRQCHEWDGEGSYFIDVDDVFVWLIHRGCGTTFELNELAGVTRFRI